MNRMIFGLILVVGSSAMGDENSIPQNVAKSEKRRSDHQAWFLRDSQGYYDKIGKKSPKWDEKVRRVYDLAARMTAEQLDPPVTVDELHRAAKAAVEAGCDDPQIAYIYKRTMIGDTYPGPDKWLQSTGEAVKTFVASKYPAYRRAGALLVMNSSLFDLNMAKKASRKDFEKNIDDALALLPESIANDERGEFWDEEWLDMVKSSLREYRSIGIEGPVALERIDAKLANLPEMEALRLVLRGWFWSSYGWEVRTKARAIAVAPENMESFIERLNISREALNEAFRLRPNMAGIAATQLDIEKGIGDGNRETMEMWFERAMTANPDCLQACSAKLDWLDAKWHGSDEEFMAFARACRDTKNWRAGITLLIGDAHHRMYLQLPQEERQKYASAPEFWGDIKPVFDEYLKHYPEDHVARSQYAVYAMHAGRFNEANQQFTILGENLAEWSHFPKVPLDAMKRMRTRASGLQRFGPQPK